MNNLKPSHTIGEFTEAEAQAVAMRAEGAKMKEIMATTGLNHSQAERAIMKATLSESDVKAFQASGEDLGSRAVAGRENGLSWGIMGILSGEPESKVRSAFTAATELKSQGLRIGKGGRFYYGDNGQPLYADVLKPTGTEIPKGAKYADAIMKSYEQRLGNLDREAVVRIAEQYTLKVKGVATKKLVAQILKAQGELAQANEDRMAALQAKNAEPLELTEG